MKIENKKGVSEVVSYVLLIIIAVSLSAIVLTFLKNQISNEKAECPDEVSLIIKEYSCESNSKINITFQNKGNFNLDGTYITYSATSNGLPKDNLKISGGSNELSSDGFLYFGISLPTRLRPGESFMGEFIYIDSIKKIQLIPFINDEKNGLLICEKRVLTQNIDC